ncbi:MAG: DNA primase [Erysipelotrichaceae bacterium]|nr:DNA primase [Erysipelotrichaceae bacterium]
MYNQDLVEAVLKHADIVQVISAYIPVEKKGRNYVALCPFHDDKNPSMQISTEKQIFKCFVCGTGGNAISFVEKYEKIPFAAALRKVAKICNYDDPRLVEDAPKAPVNPALTKLYDCINDLQNYYRYALSIPEGEEARQYLLGRDLDAATQEKYGIGYAPKDGQLTVKFLQAKGHSLKSIDDIGIALAHGETTSDHNAGRVIFPLRDAKGQVVGFSARRIKDDGTSKYVNSPETQLFHKGNVLYNYHNVVDSARRDGYCYVLEGFMDVMALDKAGIPNAVALMGTALTPQQVQMLKRLRCEIRMCLDGDGPGQAAMMKAASLLAKSGVRCRFVDYQGDLRDPDDILRQDGAEALKAKMERLIEPIDFQLAYYTHSRKLETAEERKKVLMAFLPYLRERPAGIEFEDMLVKIADATGYQAEAIRELVRQNPKTELIDDGVTLEIPRVDQTSGPGLARMLSRLENAERALLHYMLLSREAIDYFEKHVETFSSASLYRTISEFLLEFRENHEGDPDLSLLIASIEGSGIDDADKLSDQVSLIATDTTLPPFNDKALSDCATVIAEESKLMGERLQTKRAIDQGSIESGAQANKEFAAKVREKWARRPKKG